jgi:flagellar biosynthesis component FlhA
MLNTNFLQAIVELSKISSGCKFVSIRNYRNNEGEVSNYLINVGLSVQDQKEKDLVKLNEAKFENPLLEKARIEMIETKTKNLNKETASNQSLAQTDAYVSIAPNVRLHKETYSFKVTGFKVKKEVIVPIEYKAVNSSPLTIAKKKVGKEINLLMDNFRQFSFENMENTTIKLNGETIEVTY